MKRTAVITAALLLCAVFLLCAGCGAPEPVPAPSPEMTAEPFLSVPPAPAPVPTPEPTPETLPEPEPVPEMIDLAAAGFVNKGELLQVDDTLFARTYFNQEYADVSIEYLNRVGDALAGRANFYVTISPAPATYLLSPEDREELGFSLEEDAFEYIFCRFNENVIPVNVIDNFKKHNGEHLNYRTDHHWSSRAAYYAYETWCEIAGVESVPLSEYEERPLENYYGPYYDKAMRPDLVPPDTVYGYCPPGNVKLYVNYGGGDELGKETDILVDLGQKPSGTKYLTFLGSDEYRYTFVNEDITDGSACCVLKTSPGNPFCYYFSQHYQYVYVIDMRYYYTRGISGIVDAFDIDDVIFCVGLTLLEDRGGTEAEWYIFRDVLQD